MEIVDLMTKDPATCRRETGLQEVAQMMHDHDCGLIPVVDENMKPIGTVTDRDIVIRAVREGRNPVELTAADVISTDVVTATPSTPLKDVTRLMEDNMVRRIPIVDDGGRIVGIVAQADIALHARQTETAELVEEVSRPTTQTRDLQ